MPHMCLWQVDIGTLKVAWEIYFLKEGKDNVNKTCLF